MPCDSVITNTVDLGQIGDYDLLERALRLKFQSVDRIGKTFTFRVGFSYITISGGQVSGPLDREQLQEITAQVKKAYSRETVKASAKRFGWIIEQGQDEDHFAVIKR